jgi:hypothetical protein
MLPIVTIASKNYLAHVRTLAQSYLRFHPDGQVFLCLVDRVEGMFDPANEPFTLILAESLGISNWEHFAFKYTILELNTAVKPFLLNFLFKTYALDAIVYVDPDIVLYDSLDDLETLLKTYGLILTPHLLEPLNDSASPSEIDILQAGVYNLGFAALSRRLNLDRFLTWWQARLYDSCIRDVAHGLFVDQRWMDFAPSLFDPVYLWKNPGCNVAYWNLAQRAIEQIGEGYTVQGEPLKFMHFSGLTVEDIEQVSKHQNRLKLADLSPATRTLFQDYRDRLFANGYKRVKHWPYAYGKFPNGVPIPDIARAMSRPYDDRFDQATYFEWLNAPSVGAAQRPYITRLAEYLYSENPNLRRYLPEGLTRQQARLMHWLCTEGSRYYQLDSAFLIPMTAEGALGTVANALQQQSEIKGYAWKLRLTHAAKTLLGLSRYEQLRAIFYTLIGSKP